jgi:aminopeptidase N
MRIICLILCCFCSPLLFAEISPGPGISEELASERAASYQNVRYDLRLRIPASKTDRIQGSITISLQLKSPHRIVLDFEQPASAISSLRLNGKTLAPEIRSGHLAVPASETRTGANVVTVDFTAGDDSLNRSDDFLYSLFVPARAHLAFPCFDQPSVKARYSLELSLPGEWEAVSNGEAAGEPVVTDATKTIRFAETKPIPSYLFAFAAGKFKVETAERNGRTFRMFHRETDAAKVARNRDAIFDLHAKALSWLEDYTAFPYPWGKFDFVLIPAFQFGGMEHPGAIFYSANALMLDPSATQNQLLSRASTISHETAHMWFGDLVTMRWFNDVWMKEVFANFMAAKIVNPSFPMVNHDLRFLMQHYPAAYDIDGTAGANPIRQRLDNLSDAAILYGNIIYDKAPIVMRQLERITGEMPFRHGLREYLKRFAFGNATWPELVHILDARTPENLAQWSSVWVEQRGRPELIVKVDRSAQGPTVTITQRDPLRSSMRNLTWAQRIQIAVGYSDGVVQLPIYLKSAKTEVKLPASRGMPLYVLPNGGGLAYGKVAFDKTTLTYLLDHLELIQDPLTRGSAWVALWDNLVDRRITPNGLLTQLRRALPQETDEQNTELALGYVSRVFWFYLGQEERMRVAPELEQFLRRGMEAAESQSIKSAWFRTYRSTSLTPEGVAWLKRIWSRDEKIPGLNFAETDEINMALELAVREAPGWQEILNTQRDRTQNPDRKAQFEFVMPALSADPAVREQAFERFRQLENRRRERWVLESMQYLHHPLRQQHALTLLPASLELLPEIYRTGDIFFRTRWLDAALRGHQSQQAADIVTGYLEKHPELPERLRWAVLASADELLSLHRPAN